MYVIYAILLHPAARLQYETSVDKTPSNLFYIPENLCQNSFTFS